MTLYPFETDIQICGKIYTVEVDALIESFLPSLKVIFDEITLVAIGGVECGRRVVTQHIGSMHSFSLKKDVQSLILEDAREEAELMNDLIGHYSAYHN